MGLDIWKWFRKKRPAKQERVLIRPVRDSDLVWLMPLGQELEEQGHFSSAVDGEEFAGVEQMAQLVTSGFSSVGCVTPHRARPTFHGVTFNCLVIDGDPVGFVIDRDAFGTFEDGEIHAPFDISPAFIEEDGAGAIEIFLLAVRREYRGQGFGRMLLDWYISECGPGMMVVSRCPPGAAVMAGMLEHRGFEHRHTIESNKHFYWEKPTPS